MKKVNDEWVQGFMAACAITMQNHGESTIVEDTLACNYLTVAQMKKAGVDEFDIEVLKPLIKEINRKKKLTNGSTRNNND